jgi:excisionase family DNA binding protein
VPIERSHRPARGPADTVREEPQRHVCADLTAQGDLPRALTPAELARHLRVSRGRILAWIRSGELRAINTASSRLGRPRYVILPEHVREFALARRVVPLTKTPARRRRQPEEIDYFPDY